MGREPGPQFPDAVAVARGRSFFQVRQRLMSERVGMVEIAEVDLDGCVADQVGGAVANAGDAAGGVEGSGEVPIRGGGCAELDEGHGDLGAVFGVVEVAHPGRVVVALSFAEVGFCIRERTGAVPAVAQRSVSAGLADSEHGAGAGGAAFASGQGGVGDGQGVGALVEVE